MMRVLFAVRGQGLTEQWLQALGMLNLADAEVIFIHVLDPHFAADAPEAPEEVSGFFSAISRAPRPSSQGSTDARRAQALLEMALVLAGTEGIVAHTLLVEGGDVVETILNQSQSLGSDLIVLGRRQEGTAAEPFLGRVTAAVANRSRIPVLILP